jgi:hypothetical protein
MAKLAHSPVQWLNAAPLWRCDSPYVGCYRVFCSGGMNFFDEATVFYHAVPKLNEMIMKCLTLKSCTAAILGFSLLAATAADKKEIDVSKLPPASDAKGVTYDKDIKPILEKSCFKCHGPEKQKGKMRLDSLQAALKGSENGKVIEPGNSAKSILVHNVSRIGDEDDWMPPTDKGDPLSKEQVGLIRAWIDQGAK